MHTRNSERENEEGQRALMAETLRRSDMFSHWPDAALQSLMEFARLERHKRHSHALARDPQAREVLVVASGSLEVSRVNEAGKKFVYGIAGPGSTVALVRLLDEIPVPYDYYAHDEAMVIHVPCEGLRKLLDADPILWRDVAMLMLQRQRDNVITRRDLALATLSRRIAATLAWLARLHGVRSGDSIALNVRLSQDNLAAMLGVTRQSANKELRALQEAGLIASDYYNRIRILDLPALQAFASSDTN